MRTFQQLTEEERIDLGMILDPFIDCEQSVLGQVVFESMFVPGRFARSENLASGTDVMRLGEHHIMQQVGHLENKIALPKKFVGGDEVRHCFKKSYLLQGKIMAVHAITPRLNGGMQIDYVTELEVLLNSYPANTVCIYHWSVPTKKIHKITYFSLKEVKSFLMSDKAQQLPVKLCSHCGHWNVYINRREMLRLGPTCSFCRGEIVR